MYIVIPAHLAWIRPTISNRSDSQQTTIRPVEHMLNRADDLDSNKLDNSPFRQPCDS